MDVEHLATMANQIGRYHEVFPNHAEALAGIANHLRRFWDPRMRLALLARLEGGGTAGLDPLVLESIRANLAMLTPPEKIPSNK